MAEKTAVVSIVVSVVAVGVSIGSLFVSLYILANNVTGTGQTQGQQCINWEEWVVHRIQDGMSDDVIAGLTYRAVLSARLTDTSAPSSPANPTSTSDTKLYRPCGLEDLASIRQYVEAERASLGVTSTSPTPSPTPSRSKARHGKTTHSPRPSPSSSHR